MSVTIKPRTVQQRAADATHTLRTMLGLDDLRLLSASVAEATAEEIARNERFSQRIRDLYAELASRQGIKRTNQKLALPVELVPLPGSENVRVDPFAALDPFLLQRLYGSGQLRQALSVYSLSKLKEALAPVEQRNPGTKPTNRSRKDSIIEYIVEHVAGPGY